MDAAIASLLDRQDGLVSRAQLLAIGLNDADLARLVRRRELSRVHEGVFASTTGSLTRAQREWAAVLCCWPAALCHRSVVGPDPGLRIAGDDPVHVLIDATRRVVAPPGVRLHRSRHFDRVARLHLAPPRVRLEHAVLEVASSAPTERAAVAVIAQACQSRRTTAVRLLGHLETLGRLPHRAFLRSVLADVAAGAYSVLERRYLQHVERAHGLPRGARQRRAMGRAVAYRDVEYAAQRLVIELDGRLGHEAAADRWADLDRDVDTALDGTLTIRLSYGQVLQPCRVAAAIGEVLTARGWTGGMMSCGPGCDLGSVHGGSRAPGAGDPPRIA